MASIQTENEDLLDAANEDLDISTASTASFCSAVGPRLRADVCTTTSNTATILGKRRAEQGENSPEEYPESLKSSRSCQWVNANADVSSCSPRKRLSLDITPCSNSKHREQKGRKKPIVTVRWMSKSQWKSKSPESSPTLRPILTTFVFPNLRTLLDVPLPLSLSERKRIIEIGRQEELASGLCTPPIFSEDEEDEDNSSWSSEEYDSDSTPQAKGEQHRETTSSEVVLESTLS